MAGSSSAAAPPPPPPPPPSSSSSAAAPALSDEQVKRMFDEMDVDHNGQLDKAEVAAALRRAGLPDSPAVVDQLFVRADANGSQALSLDEFRTLVRENARALRAAFDELDNNGDGFLDRTEVSAALRKLGYQVDAAQVERFLHRVTATPTGGSGSGSGSVADDRIDFEHFYAMMKLMPSTHIAGVFSYWQRCAEIDIGDLPRVPDERGSQFSWRQTANVLLSGGVAGAVSRTATAPLDRLKILLQLQSKSSGAYAGGVGAGLRAIYKEGGVKAFFRGNGTNCIKIAPETGTRMLAYERLKELCCDDPKNLRPEQRFAVGAAAGAIAQMLVYPLEVVRTRLAVAPVGEYRGLVDCVMRTASREGVRALYRGMGTSVGGIVPYAGIDLMVYEGVKSAWLARNPNEKPTVMVLLGSATTSSSVAQLVTYPVGLVRTRLQAQGIGGKPLQYSGAVDCFRKILAQEGVKGLYKGMAVNYMKVLPAVSISYVVYEKVKAML